MLLKFKVYKDVRNGWRWSLVAPNGFIMGDSGEAYSDPTNAREAIKTITEHIKTGSYDVEEEA